MSGSWDGAPWSLALPPTCWTTHYLPWGVFRGLSPLTLGKRIWRTGTWEEQLLHLPAFPALFPPAPCHLPGPSPDTPIWTFSLPFATSLPSTPQLIIPATNTLDCPDGGHRFTWGDPPPGMREGIVQEQGQRQKGGAITGSRA